jgi:tetratricopeptide (TPR) repeat protein
MREKNLDEAPPDCRSLYQSGCAASAEGDFDKAIAVFNQALDQEPGFAECREALRKAQMGRAQRNHGMAKALDEVREVPELAEAEIYKRSKPLKAIRAAEQVLNRIPTSILAHKALAEAALNLGMYRTAFLSLDYVRNHGWTSDVDVNLELANAMAESGEVSRGLGICGRLLKDYPEDQRVIRTLARLSKLAFDESSNRVI